MEGIYKFKTAVDPVPEASEIGIDISAKAAPAEYWYQVCCIPFLSYLSCLSSGPQHSTQDGLGAEHYRWCIYHQRGLVHGLGLFCKFFQLLF